MDETEPLHSFLENLDQGKGIKFLTKIQNVSVSILRDAVVFVVKESALEQVFLPIFWFILTPVPILWTLPLFSL